LHHHLPRGRRRDALRPGAAARGLGGSTGPGRRPAPPPGLAPGLAPPPRRPRRQPVLQRLHPGGAAGRRPPPGRRHGAGPGRLAGPVPRRARRRLRPVPGRALRTGQRCRRRRRRGRGRSLMAPAAVALADYAREHADVHAVRTTVFVEGQGVPAELERDALDPVSAHGLARTADGTPVGTARLTPDRRIGRMAVLEAYRGRGIGEALLEALVAHARARGWPEVSLHAQLHALPFYARAGFVPCGPVFSEAGIDHRLMVRRLPGSSPVEDAEAAAAVLVALAGHARRGLSIYSRALDPGLLDRRDVVD